MNGVDRRSVLITGVLLGIGIIGALDEAIFHQLLQWHTLYWSDDEHVRVLSDGLFHLLTLALLIWGGVRIWRAPEVLRGCREALLAAVLIGAGAFNLYDGLVQHLVLHLHLVNEFVCPSPLANNSILTCPADLPFELLWLVVATVLLVSGIWWWRRASGSTISRGYASASIRRGDRPKR